MIGKLDAKATPRGLGEYIHVQEHAKEVMKKPLDQTLSQRMRRMAVHGLGPLTLLLMILSVLVFVRSFSFLPGFKFNQDIKPIYCLFISVTDNQDPGDFKPWAGFVNRLINWKSAFPEIRRGEAWRFITPVFIHLSFLRLFFNLLWLRDLGSMVESRQGSLRLLGLLLGFGIVCNLSQYFMHGPAFDGMSGVNYALAGYIWTRGKLDPSARLLLHAATAGIMFVWFFACLIGLQGGMIETTAQITGLGAGMLWGGISSIKRG